MWKLCVLALFVAYADAGVKDGFCVCEVSGRYQYQTFDDAIILFDGLCSFQLVKTKSGASRQFSINVLNEINGNVFQRTVVMEIEKYMLTIKPGNHFFVSGSEVKLPYYEEVTARMIGNTLEVSLPWMLTILFDDKQKLTIKVPEYLKGHLLGLCGDCNDNTTDDFRIRQSSQVLVKSPDAEAKIGESYMSTAGDSKCRAKAVSNKCDANKKCFQVFADPFKSCINVIGLQSVLNFIDSCKFDVCMSNNTRKDMCGAFERLANECAKQNSPVQWKKLIGCEGPCDKKPCKNNGMCIPNSSNDNYTCTCTKNFVGDNCEIANPCLSNPCKNSGTCNSTNMKGKFICKCDNKYVGKTCEIANMCLSNPCGHSGYCSNVDRTFNCACIPGYMGRQCKKVDPCSYMPCKNGGTCTSTETGYTCTCKLQNIGKRCEGVREDCVCRAFGDPHYITFDGQAIHFMGTCKYTLTATTKALNNLHKFSVEVKNEKRGSTRVSYTRFVDLKINGNTFRMLPSSKLKLNGTLMILPLDNYDEVNAEYALGWIKLTTAFGLKIEFDGKHRVIVTVPSRYMGQLTGICGDCNLKKDDYKTKSGDDVSSSKNKFSLIGTSYQVVDDSDKPETNCEAVDFVMDCPQDKNDPCSDFINHSMFDGCRKKLILSPQIFIDSCKMDLCAYKGSPSLKTIICQAVEGFTVECERLGEIVDWRAKTACYKKCGINQSYTFRAKTAQESCIPPPTQWIGEMGEGCICADGFILMGDTCVKKDQCGCSYKGMTFELDKETLTPDCSENVKCEKGDKSTPLPACKKNEDCLIQSGKRVCQCPSLFKTENNKCLVPTFPAKNMDSALAKFVRVTMAYIEGTPLKTTSTNRPGVCAVICRNNTKCKSFTFDEMKDECKLFSVNAVNETLVSVNCPFQDYYQLIESKKIVIRGGTIYPCGPLTEYAVVKTLEDCKAKCNKNNCKSMEYSVVNQECSISKSTGKDFEIIGDSEFVFYGDLPLIESKAQTVTKSG